jgi:hypothetical protein
MEQPVDLVGYVHNMLAEGVPLKRIYEALNISDPRRLKRLMSKALGRRFRVFDSSTVDEVSEKIEAFIPIREHGANWGILHVKCALARLSIRPHRRKVARALHILAGLITKEGVGGCRWNYGNTTSQHQWHFGTLIVSPNNSFFLYKLWAQCLQVYGFCMCAAYLLGCPVRGVVLDTVEALKIGVVGQVRDKASIFIISYPNLG